MLPKKWTWSGVGGDDQLEQKALLGGNVAWTIHDPPKHATLVAVGSKETEETYYVDKEDDSKEVDAEDPNRNPNPRKRGAEGQLRIKVFVWLGTLAPTGCQGVIAWPQVRRIPLKTSKKWHNKEKIPKNRRLRRAMRPHLPPGMDTL